MNTQEKQNRYDELCTKADEIKAKGGEISEHEQTERIQLYYELHPDDQYWRQLSPQVTPEDLWHTHGSSKNRIKQLK